MLARRPALGKSAHARTRGGDLRQWRAHGGQRTPIELVAIVERVAGLDWFLGGPEGNDVVQRLAGSGQLHQVDGAFAPRRGGFDPQAWALVVAVDCVLIARKGVIGLHQTEALRVFVDVGVELNMLGVVQRSADPLAVAAPHGQSIRVVNLRVNGVTHAAFVSAAAEHGGHRGDAQLFDVFACIDVGINGHDDLLGLAVDIETIGTCGAWRLEQCVDDEPRAVLGWGFEPELGEVRKLLRAAGIGVDSQAAGRKAVLASGVHRAEVTGAQKRKDVVTVDFRGLEQTKARKAEVAAQLLGIDLGVRVVEQLGMEVHLARLLAGGIDAVHAYRRLEPHAHMEKLHIELTVQVVPQRTLGVILDRVELQRVHVAQGWRQDLLAVYEVFTRQGLGVGLEAVIGEFFQFAIGSGCHGLGGEQPCGGKAGISRNGHGCF